MKTDNQIYERIHSFEVTILEFQASIRKKEAVIAEENARLLGGNGMTHRSKRWYAEITHCELEIEKMQVRVKELRWMLH